MTNRPPGRPLAAPAGLATLVLLAFLGGCVTTGQRAGVGPAVTPDELLGQEGQAVLVALGQPRRVRKEAPAEVWQYDGGTCVLDLFLYPDGGKQKVVHLEARDALNGKAVDARNCLAQMNGGTATS